MPQYRTPEGVLINGTPPPPPPDLDRSAAIADLYRRVPLEQANKAIEAATRLEGMLGYDADRKAGIPVMEALTKWSPKMYFNHPAAVASLMRSSAAGKAAPFVPSATTIDGQKMFQMSPNRFAFPPGGGEAGFTPKEVEVGANKLLQVSPKSYVRVPPPAAAPAMKENLRDINKEMDMLRKQIANAVSPKDAVPFETKLAELKLKKQTMINTAPALPGAPSVKRLVWKDGQLVPKE